MRDIKASEKYPLEKFCCCNMRAKSNPYVNVCQSVRNYAIKKAN